MGVGLLCIPTQYTLFFYAGLIGGSYVIGDLVYTFLWNSLWLPVVLTALGLAVIAIAVWFSKHNSSKVSKKYHEEEESNQLLMTPMYYMPVLPMQYPPMVIQ